MVGATGNYSCVPAANCVGQWYVVSSSSTTTTTTQGKCIAKSDCASYPGTPVDADGKCIHCDESLNCATCPTKSTACATCPTSTTDAKKNYLLISAESRCILYDECIAANDYLKMTRNSVTTCVATKDCKGKSGYVSGDVCAACPTSCLTCTAENPLSCESCPANSVLGLFGSSTTLCKSVTDCQSDSTMSLWVPNVTD